MENKQQESIIKMFDEISSKYDKINSYISFGLERYWRAQSTSLSIEYFKNSKIDILVDVACGTGKMIKSWTSQFSKNGISCKEMIGIDPSLGMLDIAKSKIDNVQFIDKLADDMPLKDESVDVISVSYGLRNIVDKKSAFLEFNRVLKNGGLIVILEFMKDESDSIVSKIKEGYIKNIIPLYGKIFADNKDAFLYLGDSIENMKEKELRDLFYDNGFDLVCIKSFTLGASHTFIAKKVKNVSQGKKIVSKEKKTPKIKETPKEESIPKVEETPKEESIPKVEETPKVEKAPKVKAPAKASKKTNTDIDISSDIRKVGISLFVEFFEEFNDSKIENKDIIDLIVEKKKISIDSAKRKVNNARKIIKNNLIKEALEEILSSAKLNETIKNKAEKYLENIN